MFFGGDKRIEICKWTGRSSEDKIKELREQLTKKKLVGTVVNMLDEVAWLFNLRGTDVDFNPGVCTVDSETSYSNSHDALLPRVSQCSMHMPL